MKSPPLATLKTSLLVILDVLIKAFELSNLEGQDADK